MRTMLTAAAVVVFVVSTGLLEMSKSRHRPLTALPPAMGTFGSAKVDAMATSSITLQRLDER
jgi:hypothetical protein